MSSKTKTTAMKEEARPALVPKLRFPEFRGAEGWKPSVLADACDMQAGKFVSASNISERNQVGLFPCYGGNGLRGYTTTHTHDGTYPLIGRQGALCGNVRLASGQFHATEHAVVATPKNAIDVVWLCHSLDLLNLNRFATGQAQPGLSVDVLENVALAIPPLEPEQQKIAECLSSVDELMAAQARKVDALKTHKKGLMQQLFPREGETQPRLRFPEFQNGGEWSEGRLADIATVLQGYGFPERHQGQKGGDYPFYKVSDISRSLAAGKVFIEESANYINESLLKELRAKPIPEGTTVFAKIGEAIRSNRRAITTVPCLIDNNAAGVKRIKGKATDMFIYLLMEQISLIDHAGGVVPAVNKSAIEEIAVKFPDPNEQECIASCLSSLDALITAETQKLEALKTHKKGLMQQLFPSPQEVDA